MITQPASLFISFSDTVMRTALWFLTISFFISNEAYARRQDWVNVINDNFSMIESSTQEVLWASNIDGVVMISVDSGDTWQIIRDFNDEGEGSVTDISIDEEDVVYISTSSNKVFITEDTGENWSEMMLNGSGGAYDFFKTLDGALIYGSYFGVYRSENGGVTWTKVIESPYFNQYWHFVGTSSGALLAGWGGGTELENGGVLQSVDDGKSWVDNATWPNKPVLSMSIYEPNDYVFVGSTLGISWSTDEAITWFFPADINLFDIYSAELLDTQSIVVAQKYSGGVFLSIDKGNSWKYVGLSNEYINDLKPSNNFIYAATSNGIFRVEKAIITKNESLSDIVTNKMEIGNAFPNPFRQSTTIRFTLPKPAHVRLTVYDLTGREVAQLVNQQMNAGDQTVDWHAENLPSGTYFYHLEAGLFSATKAVTLLK